MNNPNPECPRDDCRFIHSPGSMTAAYYPPIYDKNGVNTNPDGNISTSTFECLTCGKRWKCKTQLGERTYETFTND